MRHRGCRPCARIRGSQYPASPAAGPRPPSGRDSRGRVPCTRSSSSRARPRRRFPRSSVRRGRRGTSAHCGRYIVTEICLGMRVALKIAYDGGAFFGHQRQPDRRTVEGECLAALRAGKVVRDPLESFFRSASRTDRGVSAVGDVIAFDVRAGSFRRGMVRRIVAAMVAFARGEVALDTVRTALEGRRHDFGLASAPPLFLMDVTYGFPFRIVRKPKAFDEWGALEIDASLRLRWLRSIRESVLSSNSRESSQT